MRLCCDALRAEFGATATSVSSSLNLHTGPAGFAGHYATLHSAVLGFTSAASLKRTWATFASRYPHLARVPLSGPPLPKRGAFFWNGTAWTLPFPGSDASVVRRSQRSLYAARLRAAESKGQKQQRKLKRHPGYYPAPPSAL